MQYFRNYKAFNEANEEEKTPSKRNVAKTNKWLKNADDELAKTDDDINFGVVLKNVNKIISRSEVITDHDIQNHLDDIYDKLNTKLKEKNKTEEFEKDNRYIILKNLVDAFENEQNEKAKEIVAQANKLDEEQKKKEAEKKAAETETKTESASGVDIDKIKNMFSGTKISEHTAPTLSKKLVGEVLPEVKVLQQFLVDGGFYAKNEAAETDQLVDGRFGDKTAAAVIAYQKSKNLGADGIVGTNTWKAIFNDLKYNVAEDFKTYQIQTPAGQTEKPDNTKIKTGDGAKLTAKDRETLTKTNTEYKNITGLTPDQDAPKMSIDEVVKVLQIERLNAATVPTDEEKVAKTLINQTTNGVINTKSLTDLLAKYKKSSDENKNGLVKGIIDAFDTNPTNINTVLEELVPDKEKNSIFYDAIIGLGSASKDLLSVLVPAINIIPGMGSFADDTKLATQVFLVLAGTKNQDFINELKANHVNVDTINKILGFKPEDIAKPEEKKTEQPAKTAAKPEVAKAPVKEQPKPEVAKAPVKPENVNKA